MSRRSPGGLLTPILILMASAWPSPVLTAQERPVERRQPANPGDKGPFDVPDGSIEELQKYIEDLSKLQPSSGLKQAAVELHKNRAAAQLKACGKILAAKPAPEQLQFAVRSKIAALKVLGRLGDETAQSQLEATVAEVEKLELKDLAREVQLAALQNKAEHAGAMPDKEFEAFVESLKTFLAAGPVDAAAAELAVNVGVAAEQSRPVALASAAYSDLGKALAASTDGKFAGTAAALLGAVRRLELAGKPLILEGATVAGKPLDWRKYRGKVVLVEFFSALSGVCQEEKPIVLNGYKTYHKRGFEVIAVSIDRDRKAAEDYVDKEKLPWTVLLDRNEDRGTDKSLATRYGILAIPQMILVGRDGNVIAVNVRGKQLAARLERLFGPGG
jgi:peroxiredoxin